VQFFAWFDSPNIRKAISGLLPVTPGLTPDKAVDRFKAVIWTCIRDTPKLLQCTFDSLTCAALEAIRLGMEPGSAEGLCYLIPRFISGQWVANLEMGYHGCVKALYQNEMVALVDADVVHGNDKFEYAKGLNSVLNHVPAFEDRGDRIGAWAMVKLTTGEAIFDYMPESEIQAIRLGVRGTDSAYSPWTKYPAQMSKKTVLKRVAKYAPKSTTARRMIALDDQGEAGVHNPAQMLEMPADVAAALAPPADQPQALANDESESTPEPDDRGKAIAAAQKPATKPDAAEDFPAASDFNQENPSGLGW
jgi:recombination protein RecT